MIYVEEELPAEVSVQAATVGDDLVVIVDPRKLDGDPVAEARLIGDLLRALAGPRHSAQRGALRAAEAA